MDALVRRGPVLDSNMGPIVSIVAWILVSCSVIAVSIKLFLWVLATRRFLAEDAAIIVSLVLSVGYTAAITWASEHGLGQYDSTVSPSERVDVQEAIYASDILLVPTLASTQISIMFFLYQVTPYRRHKVILKATGGFVCALAVPSLLAVCFQCSAPAFTQVLGPSCFDQRAFWTAYGVLNILLEVAFVVLPAWIVSMVQIEFRRKLTIIFCFAFRLLIVAAWVAALAVRWDLDRANNFLHDSWRYYLCLVIIQALAVITQCIPYIRNLLLGVESGMIRTGQFRLRSASRATPKGTNNSNNSGRKGSAALELHNLRAGRLDSESRGPLREEEVEGEHEPHAV